MGPWVVNRTYKLAIGFNADTFTCAVDNQATTYTLQASDPQPSAGNQSLPKALGLAISNIAGSNNVGTISARFDNVEINGLDDNVLLNDDFD